jgi:glutamate--cysteine ligase
VQLRDNSSVGISISLEPGSQLEASVGPATSATALTAALEVFDTQFAAITHEMGVDWELVAEGFNSHISDPNNVPLIDKQRYHLMDDYLSKTGRYARDMMRCSTSTQVSVDLCCGKGFGGHKTYQLAVALGPILSFLTDNARSWRGLSSQDTPRMVRARIWEQVDPARCGTVPGTFSEDFGPKDYVDWLCTIRPILFTDHNGTTTSTGDKTVADILAQRSLTHQELAHLLSMVFPDTRLKGFAEMRTTDSLPPQLAGSLAAFMKALFYCSEAHDQAVHLLVDKTNETSVTNAWEALKSQGWDASVYGYPLTDIIDELMGVATKALQGDPDQTLLEGLFSLWRSRQVPRDMDS